MQFKARAYEWRRHYDMVAQSAYQYVESEIVSTLLSLATAEEG